MKVTGTQSWHERLFRLLRSVFDSSTGALRVAHDNATPFGEVLTAARTPVIELNSAYGVSALRDVTALTGSGSTGSFEGSIQISTGTTAGSTVLLSSAEFGRYIPGYAAEIGFGMRLDTLPTGDQEIVWGGESPETTDGFLWGRDAVGLFVAVQRGGVRVAQVYQQDWNQDPMDGTGLSGFNLDIRDGLIFQIEYTWYGFGLISFGVLGTIIDSDGRQRQTFLPCHHYRMTGQTSVEKPNVRLIARVDNGTSGENVEAFIGGRQFSVIGKYRPRFRFAHAWRDEVTTSTTYTPLVSMRVKDAFRDRSIKLQGLEAIAASETHVFAVFLNADVTGGTWTAPLDHTPGETALEANTTATGVSGGLIVWQQIVAGTQNKTDVSFASEQVNLDLPNEATLTLAVRTMSGAGTAKGGLRVTEEW